MLIINKKERVNFFEFNASKSHLLDDDENFEI